MARSENDRDFRDQAGVGPYPTSRENLVALKEIDSVRIADGEPDIRGWEVRTLAGGKVGEVDDLLLDRDSLEVVMLDIDLNDSDRHTLAPIRAAQIDRERRIVVLDSADVAATADAVVVDRAAGAAAETALPLMGRRELTADERRRLAERADRQVRYPAVGAAGSGAAAAVPGTNEEIVVERRPVVVEEVIVRRRVVDAGEADRMGIQSDRTAADGSVADRAVVNRPVTDHPLTDGERKHIDEAALRRNRPV